MDNLFDPQVGDRVIGETLTQYGTLMVRGKVERIDDGLPHTHLVHLDEPIDGEPAIWFDPRNLSEEYVD